MFHPHQFYRVITGLHLQSLLWTSLFGSSPFLFLLPARPPRRTSLDPNFWRWNVWATGPHLVRPVRFLRHQDPGPKTSTLEEILRMDDIYILIYCYYILYYTLIDDQIISVWYIDDWKLVSNSKNRRRSMNIESNICTHSPFTVARTSSNTSVANQLTPKQKGLQPQIRRFLSFQSLQFLRLVTRLVAKHLPISSFARRKVIIFQCRTP